MSPRFAKIQPNPSQVVTQPGCSSPPSKKHKFIFHNEQICSSSDGNVYVNETRPTVGKEIYVAQIFSKGQSTLQDDKSILLEHMHLLRRALVLDMKIQEVETPLAILTSRVGQ